MSNVVQIDLLPGTVQTTTPTAKRVTSPYAIVITPDCDLDWDFKAKHGTANKGKLIQNILLCTVMYSSDLAKRINNDQDPNRRFETKTPWNKARQNKDERYHFLERIDDSLDLKGEGLRSLGIDFKDFFTVPRDFLYSSISEGITLKRCRLLRPYSDHLNSRFAYFLSRIGLPEDHRYVSGEIYQGSGSSSALSA